MYNIAGIYIMFEHWSYWQPQLVAAEKSIILLLSLPYTRPTDNNIMLW